MNDSAGKDDLLDPFLTPSGMFTLERPGIALPSNRLINLGIQASSTCTIFNPYDPAVLNEVVDKAPLEKMDLFIEKYHKAKQLRVLDRIHIQDYALTLIADLVPDLLSHNPDLLLFPLRGCRQPGIVAKVITGIPIERIVAFNYTYGTRGSQQELVRSQLLAQLTQKSSHLRTVKLGIVDTAKGGHGSLHLAKVLIDLHDNDFKDQTWSVQFFLLHERSVTPSLASRIYPIPHLSNRSVQFALPLLYAVDALLVEDWDEGIGLTVVKDGEVCELKKVIRSEQIVLRDAESLTLVESSDLSRYVTGLMVEGVNRLILNDPDVKFVRDVLEFDANLADRIGEEQE